MVEPSRVHQSIRFHKRPTTSALFRTCRFLRVVKLLGVPPLHDMHSWPVMISDGCTILLIQNLHSSRFSFAQIFVGQSSDCSDGHGMPWDARGCQGARESPSWKAAFHMNPLTSVGSGKIIENSTEQEHISPKIYYATQGVHKQIRPRTRTHCSVRECLLRILVFHVCLNCVQDASFMIIHTARCILGDLSIPVPCHSSGIVVLRSVAFASEASLAPINLFSIGWDKRQTAPKTAAPLPSRYLTVNLRRSTKSTRF